MATCPRCHGRYAWNTCPAGQDAHVRAADEDTPDGQPMRHMVRLDVSPPVGL